MLRAPLVHVPVHPRRRLVVDVHPVHPDVPASRPRVLREDQRERDERPPVAGPCLHHRKERQGGGILLDHLLARGGGDGLRYEVGEPRELREHLEFLEEVRGNLRFDHLLNALRDVVEPRHAQREAHPLHRSEEVHRQRHRRPPDVLEEDRRPPGLHRPIGDLRRLEVGGDLGPDALELAASFKAGEIVAKVAKRHRLSFPREEGDGPSYHPRPAAHTGLPPETAPRRQGPPLEKSPPS